MVHEQGDMIGEDLSRVSSLLLGQPLVPTCCVWTRACVVGLLCRQHRSQRGERGRECAERHTAVNACRNLPGKARNSNLSRITVREGQSGSKKTQAASLYPILFNYSWSNFFLYLCFFLAKFPEEDLYHSGSVGCTCCCSGTNNMGFCEQMKASSTRVSSSAIECLPSFILPHLTILIRVVCV